MVVIQFQVADQECQLQQELLGFCRKKGFTGQLDIHFICHILYNSITDTIFMNYLIGQEVIERVRVILGVGARVAIAPEACLHAA